MVLVEARLPNVHQDKGPISRGNLLEQFLAALDISLRKFDERATPLCDKTVVNLVSNRSFYVVTACKSVAQVEAKDILLEKGFVKKGFKISFNQTLLTNVRCWS